MLRTLESVALCKPLGFRRRSLTLKLLMQEPRVEDIGPSEPVRMTLMDARSPFAKEKRSPKGSAEGVFPTRELPLIKSSSTPTCLVCLRGTQDPVNNQLGFAG